VVNNYGDISILKISLAPFKDDLIILEGEADICFKYLVESGVTFEVNKDKLNNDMHDDLEGMMLGFDNDNFVIWLKNKKDIATLSHELIHVLFHFLKNYEINLTENTEELFAYYMSYVMDKYLSVDKED